MFNGATQPREASTAETRWLKTSGKPPLEIKIQLESNPLKSRTLQKLVVAGRWGVQLGSASSTCLCLVTLYHTQPGQQHVVVALGSMT